MYLGELWASCRRRWYILLALILGSAGLVWVASGQVKPTYEAEATLVLLPPRNIETPRSNRYLALGGLSDSVDVLARAMGSAETAESIQEKAPGATYELVPDYATSAPILLVTASGPDRATTAAMLQAVLGRTAETLNSLQDEINVELDQRISLVTLVAEPDPVVSHKSQLRTLAVLGVGLLMVSAMVTAALDGILLWRRGRALREPDVDDPESTETALDPGQHGHEHGHEQARELVQRAWRPRSAASPPPEQEQITPLHDRLRRSS